MERNHTEDAKVFKAFCDENRLQILELLREGENCVCRLQEQLPISQSTLSHHLKILCDSGVVGSRNEGKWTFYFIDGAGSARAGRLLEELTTSTSMQSDGSSSGLGSACPIPDAGNTEKNFTAIANEDGSNT